MRPPEAPSTATYPPGMLPNLIIHADWGTDPRKRVAVAASLLPGGRYRVDAPRQVRQAGSPRERLGIPAGMPGAVLVGFDFPIGVPAAYAKRAEISSFRDALTRFGEGEWRDFYKVCETPSEISVHRPFYPYRPGGTKRKHQEDALGMTGDELRRLCERKTASRNAACSLFWTLGANQVGKAAISGWKEFVQPMLCEGDRVGLWPFDGLLADLLKTKSVVIVETYPAEFYGHLGLRFPGGRDGGKQSQSARTALADQLLVEADRLETTPSDAAREAVTIGYGARSDGEDDFDAMVGLLGMVKHLRAGAVPEAPPDTAITRFEGWMIGRHPAAASRA